MKYIKLSYQRLLVASVFITILSVIIFVSSFFAPHKEPPISAKTSLPCSEVNCSAQFFLVEQRTLEERLLIEDPAEIYADVLSKYAGSAVNNQHAIAHIFGEVLYKSKGLAGITICDNSFAFGCFHGFMINAMVKEGVSSVHSLDRMCNEKFGEYNLGCQHGLGHGIAEYYGSSRLNESLDTCASLSWKHQLMGCSGGVLMEYIMPTLSENNPGSVKINPVNAKVPYLPCTNVKDQYKPECFYNLGNYFYHALNQDARAGLTLCENIPDPRHRKICLLGFGNAIFSNAGDISATIQSCKLAADKEDEITCRSGAAWILYANPLTRSETKKLCEQLNESDFKKCEKESNLLKLALET